MLTNRAMHKKGIDAVDRTIGKSRYAMSPVAECRSTKRKIALRPVRVTLMPFIIREDIMTNQGADASRRDFVAAAVTVAAAAGAASGAQAQTPSNLRFSNPPGMSKPAAYSHVVEVNGPHRTVYLAGQTGIDANGKVAEGFRAQAVQVMENIKTALASVGGGFEHVVKLTSYLTNLEANGAEFREVRGSYFPNKTALPASTLLQISRLANPAYLVEVEVIAILPPKA
jgi:2-iminobutanoate/2-iminopropanoate deaminase